MTIANNRYNEHAQPIDTINWSRTRIDHIIMKGVLTKREAYLSPEFDLHVSASTIRAMVEGTAICDSTVGWRLASRVWQTSLADIIWVIGFLKPETTWIVRHSSGAGTSYYTRVVISGDYLF
jgi:hypothetical protein